MKSSLKVIIVFKALFKKLIINADGETITKTNEMYFASNEKKMPDRVTPETNVEKLVNKTFDRIKQLIEDVTQKGSGWIFENGIALYLNTAIFNPFAGGTYIKSYDWLAKAGGFVNPHNHSDNKCAKWSILAAKHPVATNAAKLSNYIKFEQELKDTGLQFPLDINEYKKFCKMNELNVNLFWIKKTAYEVIPLKQFRFSATEKVINIGLLSETINNKTKYHYIWIKNLSAIYPKTSCKHKKYYCPTCLHGYTSEDRLNAHQNDCNLHDPTKIRMPTEKEKYITFMNYHKMLKAPFIIYADFECLIMLVNGKLVHVPCGFAIKVVSSYDQYNQPIVYYRGKDCMEVFYNELIKFKDLIFETIKINIAISHHPYIHKDKFLFELINQAFLLF